MGSVYVPAGEHRGLLGKKQTDFVFFQFVPGYVYAVCTNTDNFYSYGSTKNINSIMAIPHLTDKSGMTTGAEVNEQNRYWPLLRGMVDVPAKGDPVLLCTFGGQNYYLGPLNIDNEPNFNVDPEIKSDVSRENTKRAQKKTQSQLTGRSPNFKQIDYARLVKIGNDTLDFREGSPGEGIAKKEQHGDMVFEGRHGNSIRIGSRYKNPYIKISNGRSPDNFSEKLGDGSLISLTNRGTLKEHYGSYIRTNIATLQEEEKLEYTLSSDEVENVRSIESLLSYSNGNTDAKELIYNYSKPQMLLRSERIIIDSKKDDIFFTSSKDIHIGTGRNLLVSTNNDIIFSASTTYLGSPYKRTSPMQNMVLGSELLTVLRDLVHCLSTANFTSPAGMPLPVHDNGLVPLINANPAVQRKGLNDIKNDLNKILSNKHFIEPND
jgi:hypothetical protein